MPAHVGFIVSWKVPESVDVITLRDGLRAAGLDPDLAPDLKPASVVSRASSYLAKVRSGTAAKFLSRPVGYALRQITLEQHVGDDLTYTREAGIGLAADGQTLQSDEPVISSMLTDTAKTIKSTRTASDITRIVQQVVQSCGSDLIPVREQGGAYFIPAGNDVITKVDMLLTTVGGSLSRFACTLGHGTDESVSLTITDYLVKQIQELQESVEALNEKGIRSDVKNRRISRVAELKEKISVYASLMVTGTEKLNAELERAEALLLAKLGADADEDAASAPEAEAA
jgi:hypothetical protein